MKRTFFAALLMLGILASGAFMPLGSAYAQGFSFYAPGQQYNLLFHFRGVDRQIRTQEQMRLFLQDLIAYLEQLQLQLRAYQGGSEVQVTTRSATGITDTSATLRGLVSDFNNSKYADVWFLYGRYATALTTKSGTERLSDSSSGDFDRTISNLQSDTKYYFRAAAEDDQGRTDYGSIQNFTTSAAQSDAPAVTTQSASAITKNSATLRGTVDMQDFRNGRVFFVYGEDKARVDGIEHTYTTYEGVSEHGADLQKVLVDWDLDGNDSYTQVIGGLASDTQHYFSLCVAFENSDADNEIICAPTRTFTTDAQ